MIKLGLVRHDESIWNLENKFTGWIDVKLSEENIQKAIVIGNPICYELDDNLKPIKHYYLK